MLPLIYNFDTYHDYPDDLRLFVSCAASDFDVERRFLMTRVYKKFRKYCRNKYGIDCYICDLDWGHRIFPNVLAYLDEMRKSMLTECIQNSAGPCLIVLAGQKYHANSGTLDSPGLPSSIPHYGMGCIQAAIDCSRRADGGGGQDAASSKNRRLRDADVWLQCYLQDRNRLDRDYVFHQACYNVVRNRIETNYLLYTLGSTFKCLEINKNMEVDEELKSLSDECLAQWIRAFLAEALRICVEQKKLHKYPDFMKSRFHRELEYVLGSRRLKIVWPLKTEESSNVDNSTECCQEKQLQSNKNDDITNEKSKKTSKTQDQLERRCQQRKKAKNSMIKEPPPALISPNKADVLVIKRHFVDLHNFLEHAVARVFGEVVDERFSEHPSRLDLERLSLIQQTLEKQNENARRLNYDLVFRVPYGVDRCFHRNYLKQLTNEALRELKSMVDSSFPRPLPRLHPINQEINQHLRTAQRHSDRFIGREGLLHEVKEYVCNYANHKHTLVFHGPEACGKAALASKVFKEAPNWFGCAKDVIRVIRFIGTTDQSRSLIPLMTSILVQIKLFLIGPSFDHYRDVPIIAPELSSQLEEALLQANCFKRLLLVLVGVDLLTPEDQALTANWLPTQHANNARVIVTMETSSHVMKWFMRDGACANYHFLKVPPVSTTESSSILLSTLAMHARTISSLQLRLVTDVCLARNDDDAFSPASPLHPQILACHLLSYSSFDDIDAQTLHCNLHNMHTSFIFLLQKIEEGIGFDLSARILGLLCASMGGLSDNEMEDVLTRDPVAMTIIKDDDDEAKIKFPSVAWLFVKHALRHLLWRRHDNDVQVWCWRHPLLCRLATERYIAEHATVVSLNCLLAEHWIGSREKQLRPVMLDQPLRFVFREEEEENKNCESKEDGEGNSIGEKRCHYEGCNCSRCCKMVCVEEREEAETKEKVVLFNRRKLMHLPRQLVVADRFADLLQQVVFNFEWLLTKTEAFSLREVISDLRLVAHPEARVLEEAMWDAYEFIDDDVRNMAYELTRRLLMFRRVYACLSGLIDEMDRRAEAFLVGMPVWRRRVGVLEREVDVGRMTDCVLEACVDGRPMLFVKAVEDIEVAMLDAIKMTLMALFKTSRGTLYVTPNGQKCCVCDDFVEVVLGVYDVTNGVYLGNVFPLHGNFPLENTSLKSFCLSNEMMFYAVEGPSSWLSVRNLSGDFEEMFRIALATRPTFLVLSTDHSYIFTATRHNLIGLNLSTNQRIKIRQPSTPYLCCTDAPTATVFIACQPNSIRMLDLQDKRVVRVLEISSVIKKQGIRRLSYDVRGMLLITCDDDIILYDCVNFVIVTCIHRPCDLPDYFRFPGEYWTRRVNFEDAVISGNYIVACVMRDVRVWRLKGGELVAVMKAPIGHLKGVHVINCDADEEPEYENVGKFEKQNSKKCELKEYPKVTRIFSVLRNSRHIQAWRLDEALMAKHVNPPDRLSPHSIKQLGVSPDGSVVMATGGEGGEVGLFDSSSGHVRDLLTHEAPVLDFNLSRDGSFALVSVASSKEGRHNKVWSVHERRMMDEFGNAASITVPAATQDAFYSFMLTEDCRYKLFKIALSGATKEFGGVANKKIEMKGKDTGGGDRCEELSKDLCDKKVNLACESLDTSGECEIKARKAICSHSITSLHVEVNKLAQKPFITCQDGWLVSLTSDQSFKKKHFSSQMISAYRLSSNNDANEKVKNTKESKAKPEDILQVYPSMLRESASAIKQFLYLHRHPSSKDSIIVIFSNQPSACCCSKPEERCDEVKVMKCSCQVEKPPCFLPPPYQPFDPQTYYKTCYCAGLLILDLSRMEVDFIVEDLLPACTYLDRLIVSRDVTTLYDSHSNVYNLCLKGAWMGVVKPKYPHGSKVPKSDDMKGGIEERFGWPMSVLLHGRVLLYVKTDYLTLVRVVDYEIIGRVCVHTPITAIAVACDEKTVYVGGLDGTVSSYVVVDVGRRKEEKAVSAGSSGGDGGGNCGGGGIVDDNDDRERESLETTIKKIESRQSGNECARVWDVTGKFPRYLYKSGDIGGGRSVLVDEGATDGVAEGEKSGEKEKEAGEVINYKEGLGFFAKFLNMDKSDDDGSNEKDNIFSEEKKDFEIHDCSNGYENNENDDGYDYDADDGDKGENDEKYDDDENDMNDDIASLRRENESLNK